jgi:hypothetical protein
MINHARSNTPYLLKFLVNLAECQIRLVVDATEEDNFGTQTPQHAPEPMIVAEMTIESTLRTLTFVCKMGIG